MHFLHRSISLSGQAEVLGLGIDDDKHRVGAVSAHELVDGDVIRVQLRTRVIPADNLLTSYTQHEGTLDNQYGFWRGEQHTKPNSLKG